MLAANAWRSFTVVRPGGVSRLFRGGHSWERDQIHVSVSDTGRFDGRGNLRHKACLRGRDRRNR
jgi:hypothetical protein